MSLAVTNPQSADDTGRRSRNADALRTDAVRTDAVRPATVRPDAVERALEHEIRRPLIASLALVGVVVAFAGGVGWRAWRGTRLESVTAANVLADPVRYANRPVRVWAIQAFASDVREQVTSATGVTEVAREYKLFNTGSTPLYVGVRPGTTGTTGTSVVGRVIRTPDWLARRFPQVGSWIVESEAAPTTPFALLLLASVAVVAAMAFAVRSVRQWRDPRRHPGVQALGAFGRVDHVLEAVQQELQGHHDAEGALHLTASWLVALQPNRVRVLPRSSITMVHIARGEGGDDRVGRGSERLVVKGRDGQQLDVNLRSAAAAGAAEQFVAAHVGLAQRL